MKLIYHLVDSAIVNSYVIYNWNKTKHKHKNTPQIHFRCILANQLIGKFTSRKNPGRQSLEVISKQRKKLSRRALTVANSFVLPNVGEHLPKKDTRRRCAYCSTRAVAKRTTICSKCNVALRTQCFGPLHKQQ
jgi:hypothetical protein